MWKRKWLDLVFCLHVRPLELHAGQPLPDFGCLPCLHHVQFCMGDFAIDKDTGPWMVVSVVSFAQMKPHLESWQS